MLLYKDHPQKIAGDTYSGSVKIQIIFSLGFLLLLLLGLAFLPLIKSLSVPSFILSGLSLLILLITQIRLFIYILNRQDLISAVLVSFLQVFRSLAWSIGAIEGGLRYGSLLAITKNTVRSMVAK
jgi:hypothetical protein